MRWFVSAGQRSTSPTESIRYVCGFVHVYVHPINTQYLQAAIDDLEFLRRTAPEEANVIFQLAKAYRLIGDEDQAAKMLAVARDAAPRSVNKMQKLLELVKDVGDDKMDEG